MWIEFHFESHHTCLKFPSLIAWSLWKIPINSSISRLLLVENSMSWSNGLCPSWIGFIAFLLQHCRLLEEHDKTFIMSHFVYGKRLRICLGGFIQRLGFFMDIFVEISNVVGVGGFELPTVCKCGLLVSWCWRDWFFGSCHGYSFVVVVLLVACPVMRFVAAAVAVSRSLLPYKCKLPHFYQDLRSYLLYFV